MAPFRFAALALLALSVGADAAAPPAAPVTRPAPLALAPGVKRGVLSPEGRTITARVYGTPDTRIGQLQAEISAIRQQRTALIARTPIDLDKLEPLLRQEELLQTELRSRNNDRLMLLLRSLPEVDRVVVLQNMANPARPQSSAKPATAN